MKKPKHIPILVLALFIFNILLAQQANSQIKGKVTDVNGLPLSSVTVTVKGTKTSVITNAEGEFTIPTADQKSILIFSYVGFQNQQLTVGNQSNLEVKLVPSAANLNEVVVTGYGTQMKREITSAITRVDAAEFNKGNITNVSQLLQGKVAGLSITRAGGDPNGDYTIRLRGLSTLGANTQPLIVVDGLVGADINSIDPNDIASMDVLKDGSSAAIYGTRGSAGVIIITTKAGLHTGLPRVSYNGNVTSEKADRFTQHMSPQQFRALIKSSGAGTDYGASTDWDKEITQTAISYAQNLTLSGGSQHNSYDASVNYRNGQGIAINTGYQQISAHVSLTQKALNDKLVFNINLNGIRRNSQVGYQKAFEYATIYNPTAPVHVPVGSVNDIGGGGWFEFSATDYSNPVALLVQNSNNVTRENLNFLASAEYEITKGLKFLVRYAQQITDSTGDKYSPINAYANSGIDVNSNNGFGRHGFKILSNGQNTNELFESTLTYNTFFKDRDLNLTALAGYSWNQLGNKGNYMSAGNFVTDDASGNIGAALDIPSGLATVNSYHNGSLLIAFFGRVLLNYKNFAFLAASLRREGSTQFGSEHQWGNFPAISGGLDFAKLFPIPTVTNLKLRASYGVTGSLPPYSYLSLSTLTISGSYYAGNNLYGYTYAPNQNPNPNLKWETKAETDIGLDFTLFNSRLTGTMDYFNRNTSNLIFNVTVPVPPNLVPTTWENIGTLTSNGFELALNYDVIKGNSFSWNTGFNYSSSHVVLKSLDPSLAGSYVGASNLGSPGQEATQITRAMQGFPIGLFYQAVYKGVDQNGKYLFDDGKGNAVADNNSYKTIIGNGLPKFEIGWVNTFKYGNFDLEFFFRGVFGHELINTYRAFYENPTVSSVYNVVNTKYYNPNVKDAQLFSSLFVEKGDYVSLDYATIGYNFPIHKSPDAGGIHNFRAYIGANHLFLITSYTGADPSVRYQDQNANPPNILAPGIDRRETWAWTRSFTLGVTMGF